ncbi:MAG: T9SS type A sorting domain-containing protein [Bacteroidota bacterium]
MKKIYLSIASMVLCGSIIGQNAPIQDPIKQKAILPTNMKAPKTGSNSDSRAGGPFRMWIEPVGDVMTQKGLNLDGTANADQDTFLSIVYMDSTVRIGSGATTNRFVNNIFMGSVLDPKSTNLQDTFEPIVTMADGYNIDSILILGSYVKKTNDFDTLYVWLVWGDTTNTSVFSKRLTNTVWVAPISTWRTSVIGPKVTGATTAQGNKVTAAAPSTNKILVKYVLQATDSSASGYSKYINIPLVAPAAIPAGNIVSCFYTFVPGGTHAIGDCAYSFTGAAVAQNVNGFAGIIWSQLNPTVTALADYVDHQVDASSWCMGTSYYSTHRYSSNATYNNSLRGDLLTAPLIYYSIYGNSTVGVSELEKNGFALGQNTPNPFTNQTTINYQIKKAAENVTLEVYDVRGTKMFNKTQTDVKQGTYSIEINNVNFASGIYFYSLIVDGNKVTKKMIVQ